MNGIASIPIYGTAFLPNFNNFKYTELFIIDLSEVRAFIYIPSYISRCVRKQNRTICSLFIWNFIESQTHRTCYFDGFCFFFAFFFVYFFSWFFARDHSRVIQNAFVQHISYIKYSKQYFELWRILSKINSKFCATTQSVYSYQSRKI